MQQQTRAVALGVARFGAVVFALCVLGYLVVTAQRRAGDSRAAEDGASVTDSSAADESGDTSAPALPADAANAAPSDANVFLFGSKSMPLESVEGVTPEVFLSTSKSAVIDVSPVTAADDAAQSKSADATFLPSSKFKTIAPLPASSAKPAKRVFLPSSKSLRVEPAPAPVVKPTTPVRPVD